MCGSPAGASIVTLTEPSQDHTEDRHGAGRYALQYGSRPGVPADDVEREDGVLVSGPWLGIQPQPGPADRVLSGCNVRRGQLPRSARATSRKLSANSQNRYTSAKVLASPMEARAAPVVLPSMTWMNSS
jgi:hypothetical protein